MRNKLSQIALAGIALLSFTSAGKAQPATATTPTAFSQAPIAAAAPTPVPALIPYSGWAADSKGRPLTEGTLATFLIYKDQKGGEPLFTESQVLSFDEAGHYKIQLGAANPNGLPADLFLTGEARWLEVQIAGQQPEPRVLLASVPYALKAADAATLGGLPASAFALAGSITDTAGTTPAAVTSNAATTVTTTGGAANRVAKFSGANTVVNSLIYDNGTQVGIGTTSPSATLTVNGGLTVDGISTLNGQAVLAAAGTATSSKSYPSQSIRFNTSAYNSSTKAVVPPHFQLQAEAINNNSASPGATFNLLASTTSSTPTETGLYFNTNGTIHFAAGQTFPGTGTGIGTITGVTAGTGLTGGGTSGKVTLSLNTALIPGLSGNNTFTGSNIFGPSIYEKTDVNIDYMNTNPGNISPGLRFGSASGEGMSSKRTAGGNQYGLDLYTDYAARMQISAGGQIGINTAPVAGSQLKVASTVGDGIYGTTTDNNSGDDVAGVHGFSNTVLSGVEGRNYTSGSGFAAEANGPGVYGIAGEFYSQSGQTGPFPAAVYGTSYRYSGVYGESNLLPGVNGNGYSIGVSGFSAYGIGVDGETGNYAGETGDRAGYFDGEVDVRGTLTADAKDFKIDHPSDPANKFLYHASVESSEMMNIYSGNATTDEFGVATVTLPSWFEAENGDFRYQLTIIGRKAQAWVSQEVKDGKFVISSDATFTKVSWQITAVRQDAYAKAHPLVAEQEKPEKERGFYKHPELYGQPEQKQLEWARNPEFRAALKAKRDAAKVRVPGAEPGKVVGTSR